MTEKTIHAYIYDPSRSIFKTPPDTKAELTKVRCTRSADCDVFARGECIVLQSGCVYGHKTVEMGYTKRARKFRTWIVERAKTIKDVGRLKYPTEKLAVVGDFVWLPYPHMTHARTGKVTFFPVHHENFIPFEEFTVELIVKLCEARPRAVYGGEITNYQKKSVPRFLSHLTEMYPRMLAEAAEQSEHIRKLLTALTKVGRKAILQTLVPNVGTFNDGDKVWTWDGIYLTSTTASASTFLIVRGAEVRLLPVERAVVKVTDGGQVGPDTEFVD